MSLTRTQYNRIMSRYDEWQYENLHRHQARLEEIKKNIPEWTALSEQLPVSASARVRALLLPETTSDPNLDCYSPDEIRAKKEALLLRYGYPADYLSPSYHCPDCRDTGYIGSEKCHCFKQMETQLLYDQSGLNQILDQENFSFFDDALYSDDASKAIHGRTPRQNIQRVLNVCLSFVDQFQKSPKNLLFYGTPGVGKTFLTNCIAKELLQNGHSVIYLSSVRLFDLCAQVSLRSDVSPEAQTAYDSLYSCDLLIIDDLGAETTNRFVQTTLFHLVNERLLKNKPMIISTNLTLDGIRKTYGERVFSRITSRFDLLLLFGDDIRLKKRLSQS